MNSYRAANPPTSEAPIVVTGGAGYIGSMLVRQLLERGDRVRVVDNLLYGDDAIRAVLGHPNLELVVGDVRDAEVLDAALSGARAVAHLAAIVGDAACALDEPRTRSTNTAATQLVGERCRAHGVPRMVFASTCSVYGASDEPLNETSSLNPVSLYARSKITAEQVVLAQHSSTFTPTVLRFGTAYGASARPRFDLVVNLLTAKAVRDGAITIHGGDQWRPFVHVEDIARSIALAIDAPRWAVDGQIINIGSDSQNLRLSELGTAIQRLVPDAAIVTEDRITDRRNYYVRFRKAREQLGFLPDRSLAEGVAEMVNLLREGRVGDHHEARYHNVQALAQLRSAGDAPFALRTPAASGRFGDPVSLDQVVAASAL